MSLRRRLPLSFVVCLIAGLCGRADAQPLKVPTETSGVRPEQDDATLHAVTTIGSSLAWVVGDRGTLFRSTDGGVTWAFVTLPSPAQDYSLHSICFLTDRVGWIAGGMVLPAGGVSQGLILATRDGGKTWTALDGTGLPYLRYVQFFDLEHGIAIGERSTRYAAGVLRTEDGGQTWLPMNSQKSSRWNAAAFSSYDDGVLVGARGRQGVVSRGSIQPGGPGARGLRAFHDVSLDAAGRGWAVGDGGLLLRTENSGVSWGPPFAPLPRELDDFVDFHCVAHHGDHIWVAGAPGSVIWHSGDDGSTWSSQSTGESIPLEALHVASEQQGIAVGQLGRICVTRDGGRTWQTVRGQNRRLACLSLHAHADKVDLSFLTRWSRADGYRAAIVVATRQDLGADGYAFSEQDVRLSHAALTAGGGDAVIDWRLPLALPGLVRNQQLLVEEWSRLTDRRLTPVLLGALVARIRTWKPSVVLIDEPDEGDCAAELTRQAVTAAIDQAASPVHFPEQLQLAGLRPWPVQKLILHRRDGVAGPISQDPLEVLPQLGTTLDDACAQALCRLGSRRSPPRENSYYLVLKASGDPPVSDRSLFSDLTIPAGSDARRALATITSIDYEQLLTEANHRRTMNAISKKMSESPDRGGQLLGQLRQVIGPLSPERAALQLADLGAAYRASGNWPLAESIYVELISRYPTQPAAVDAMLWLMTYWTSAEMNWQRLRTVSATKSQFDFSPQLNAEAAQANFEQAVTIASEKSTSSDAALNVPEVTLPVAAHSTALMPTAGNLQSVVGVSGQAGNQQQMMLTRWQRMAGDVANGLKQSHPQLFESPQIQFVTAALLRRRRQHAQADEIYGSFLQLPSDDPWNAAARGELYLLRPGVESPKPVIVCRRTTSPPNLDGTLSDRCWLDATEIRLGAEAMADSYVGTAPTTRGRREFAGQQPIVMVAYDDANFYLAASVPIRSELPPDPPQAEGRVRDADLDRFDRLTFQFDVDRDYATYYRFDVDQRGWTREACWEDWSYNPAWECAAARTSDSWRVECAIPLKELLPPARIAGATWAVGIARVMPALGSQSWTQSGAEVPLPPLFGLLKFE